MIVDILITAHCEKCYEQITWDENDYQIETASILDIKYPAEVYFIKNDWFEDRNCKWFCPTCKEQEK